MLVLASLLFYLLPIGEQLHYTIRFGPFQVGTLDLTIENISLIEQESCYHFVARLKSDPKLRFLFRIDDHLESFARIRDFATLKSFKRISESGYKNQIQADFNYRNKQIYYSDSSVLDLKPGAKDLLSTWYYFRTLNLKSNDTFSVLVHTDKKNYDIEITTFGPKVILTGIGKLECLIVTPRTQIKQDVGTVYLSNDARRLPAMIKKRFSFGSIVAVLVKIGG